MNAEQQQEMLRWNEERVRLRLNGNRWDFLICKSVSRNERVKRLITCYCY